MVADTHIGALSVLTGAIGLAEASVCSTFVYVWKENHTFCCRYLFKSKHHLTCNTSRVCFSWSNRKLDYRFIFKTFWKPESVVTIVKRDHVNVEIRTRQKQWAVETNVILHTWLFPAYESVASHSQKGRQLPVQLTLASPSSYQHVTFLAFAVVWAHAVDTAPPLAVGRPLTLIDI